MTKSYDKHYKTQDYFGKPYPELIQFFRDFPERGKLVDLGCGQGRNAIPLSKLGYEVLGIDSSYVGIQYMLDKAKYENLDLTGLVGNIYKINEFSEYNFILLDSIFHFQKNNQEKEIGLVKQIIDTTSINTLIVFCIRNSVNKIKILNDAIDHKTVLKRLLDIDIKHRIEWEGVYSEADYKIISICKS